ncbi:MAG: hypothetical protein GF388_06995, partial [Candidatus Aegiribacteria sp.]|nr:hypothetical protein [Candidatus Aegiribacteria sp.]
MAKVKTKNSANDKSQTAKNADKSKKKDLPERAVKNHIVEFPPAPLGKSRVGVIIDGKEQVFDLKDKRLDLTKVDKGKQTDKRISDLKKQFIAKGFKDASSVTPGKNTQKKIEEREKEKAKPKVYRLYHPDGTNDSPINAKTSVEVSGEAVELEIKD